MIIRDISKPVTAKSLNESLAKRFGQKLNLSKFTVEQLEDARNRLRTSLSQFETNESYDSVQNEKYQQAKLMQDVIVAELEERHNYNTPKKVKKKMKESTKVIIEGAEDQAELVMAAKDMVDRVTGWMEDTAEMQTESMLELADAIRDEMGNEQSEAFVSTVKPALEQLYAAMETTRGALTGGVGQLTGEAEPVDTMGAEPEAGGEEEPAMEPTVDAEEAPEGGDEFGAAAPAAGGEDEAGRARRESIQRKRKMLETSRRLGTLLSKKK